MARFNLSVDQFASLNTVIKPGPGFLGFICIVVWGCQACAASDYLFSRYLDLFIKKPSYHFQKLSDSTHASWVETAFTYDDVIHQKTKKNGQTKKKIIGEVWKSHTKATLLRPLGGITAFLSISGLYGAWIDTAEKGAVSGKQNCTHFGIAAWTQKKHLSSGFYLGKSSDDIINNNSNQDNAAEQIASSIVKDLSIDYELFLSAHLKGYSLQGSVSRYLNHATPPVYKLFSNGNFKSFPLAAATRSYAVQCKAQWPKSRVSISLSRREYITDTIVSSANALPMMSEFVTRELTINGAIGNNTPRIEGEFLGTYTGGYIEGYSGSFAYLNQNDIVLKKLFGQIALVLPGQITTGVFYEYLQGFTEGYGYFKDAPFSSWTILNPGGYRFQDFQLDYFESGLFCEKKFSIGKTSELDCGLSFSRTFGMSSFIREDKKIVVWIPVYVNDTLITLFDFEGWNGGVHLNFSKQIKKVRGAITLIQQIPIWKKRGTKWGSGSGPDEGVDKTRRGGTEYALSVKYEF